MIKFTNIIILFAAAFLLWPVTADAQFYNGHQMKFGKNRVQYNTFYWKYYRFDKYDVYSYEEGTELSLYVADYAEKEITRIEQLFDYTFERRLIFIIYNKLSDFRQSNIGQTAMDNQEAEQANVGGVTRIIQNKIFVYFEGDHKKLEKQISKSITEALVNEMLYGNDFKDNFTSSTLLNLPEWYLKGLVSYVSDPWNFKIENRVKDGIIYGRYKKFNRLRGVDALYAGHSFWKYIADTYGESVIPNILYLTRINKNVNTGFLSVLGLPLKNLADDWLSYYRNLYEDYEAYGSLPSEGKVLKRTSRKKVYLQAKISPDGRYIAYVTNQLGQSKIYLYDTQTGKKRKIEKEGHKIEQIDDYSYPILAWHPTGRILAFLREEKGKLRLTSYDIDNDEYASRIFVYYEKILDFSYSNDGLKFVISGVYRGQTDIYVHDIASGTNQKITSDLADDLHPRFINNSNEIVFTSNRRSDSLVSGNKPSSLTEYMSVFVYDYKNKPDKLKRITDRNFVDHTLPFPYTKKNEFVFLSNKSGIINRYFAKYDSTISFIDTTTHYRYFAETYPLTNYSRNIVEHYYVPAINKYSQIIYNDGRFEIYQGDVDPSQNLSDEIRKTPFRVEYTSELSEKDSILNVKMKHIPIKDIINNSIIEGQDTIRLDFTNIDINNYVFEKEKLNYYNARLGKNNLNLVMDTVQQARKMYIDYETSFYPNYLVNQVDFSFMNASYQTFTGGAVYYNPGMNLSFKVGANDLFEDYRIIGGVRLATDFDSNEYLLSFEDLKTRWDKQVVFHRQIFKVSAENALLKTYSHELMFILKYPFNQVAAIKGTAMYRNDRSVYLSTDLNNLNQPDIVKPWASLKLEYIYDDTRFIGINLYQGLRYKLFAEGYKELGQKKSDLVVLGADIRHYTRIHRSLIWANRFAASTSFGHTPLIYYLGGVDNWTKFNPNTPTFDQSVPIDYTRNYAFQTLATNMRGFIQNIRNGNNFALINTELRWPIIRYFANRPISSSFLNNLQVVGFFDIGTAWTGLTPWSGKNAYDTETYENGPIKVVIDSNREPIVAGYGGGVRSRIFGYFVRL
ncbi:MAG TPA: hypothetical protein VE870_08905, partial [Bacteroidales bacterium]|nr:hypothetical protein [Bacteroidales bacterium]